MQESISTQINAQSEYFSLPTTGEGNLNEGVGVSRFFFVREAFAFAPPANAGIGTHLQDTV